MKPRNKEKLYIYYRENKKCFYCSKNLSFKQMSIDHFYPLSKGGTNDIFNIVCSCKKCNREKENTVLKNSNQIVLELFIKAVKDDMILGSNLDISNRELKEILLDVNGVKIISSKFVFESNNYRFYVKENKIEKYIFVFSI